MSIDINTFDIGSMIVGKLQEVLGDVKEVPSPVPGMDSVGETTWYAPGDSCTASFQTLRAQTVRNVEIKNFFNRETLDTCNSFIITLTPSPELPLPMYAADVDVHKGKYVHVITDLIPLSRSEAYGEKYGRPVKLLREKYKDLPGLVDEVTEEIKKIYPALGPFKAFSSEGMIFGNIPVEHGPQIIEMLSDYVNLYASFIMSSAQSLLLNEEPVRHEAAETLKKFMMMMTQFDFTEDMPNEPKR